MNELPDFLQKMLLSDSVIVTRLENRAYCRFYNEGTYVDRMYVYDANLMTELFNTVGEGYELDAKGISKIKQLYLAV